MRLKDRTALVTGGSRGIGRAIADRLAAEGASVIVTATNEERIRQVAAEIAGASGADTLGIAMDVASAQSVADTFAAAKEFKGSIDILVNNAGITRDTLLMRMKDEDWDAVMDTNLKSVFLSCREAIKIMAKQRSGSIINISSIVAFMGNAGQANYSASKAGMVGLTRSIAKEYAGRGIRANAVAPGFIVTAMTEALPDKVKDEMMKAIPSGKFGQPADVAAAVAFLASDDASYVTGQVLHVNGGMYM